MKINIKITQVMMMTQDSGISPTPQDQEEKPMFIALAVMGMVQ